VAKLGRWVAKLGRWVAKLVARLLATAALWFESGHLTKKLNGLHKERSGHKKKCRSLTRIVTLLGPNPTLFTAPELKF